MIQREPEPRDEPIAYYFRDLLLIGGEATRLYLVRHAHGERRVIWRLNDVAHLDGMPPGFGGIS